MDKRPLQIRVYEARRHRLEQARDEALRHIERAESELREWGAIMNTIRAEMHDLEINFIAEREHEKKA